jgi:hypothetical protein
MNVLLGNRVQCSLDESRQLVGSTGWRPSGLPALEQLSEPGRAKTSFGQLRFADLGKFGQDLDCSFWPTVKSFQNEFLEVPVDLCSIETEDLLQISANVCRCLDGLCTEFQILLDEANESSWLGE